MNARHGKAVFAALALGTLAGCGSSTSTDDAGSGTDIGATTAAPAEETTTTIASVDEEPAETEPPATEPVPSIDWSGPNFVDVADARMAELEPPIGQVYSADAVVPVFEMPTNFPDMAGTITGVFHVWEVDIRDGARSEERIVGADTVAGEEDLNAHGAQFVDNEAAPWKFASISDGGDNFIALFTSQGDAEPGQRLALKAYQAPDAGEPNFQWNLEIEPSELVAPSWAEALPIPEGGELAGFREGIGVVEDFGTTAENGFLEITTSYPAEALPELEAFFSTDVIKQAGFTYEDTPFNNQSVRIDLSAGDWVGVASVWKGSYGDTTYYGVTWTLWRPVG